MRLDDLAINWEVISLLTPAVFLRSIDQDSLMRNLQQDIFLWTTHAFVTHFCLTKGVHSAQWILAQRTQRKLICISGCRMGLESLWFYGERHLTNNSSRFFKRSVRNLFFFKMPVFIKWQKPDTYIASSIIEISCLCVCWARVCWIEYKTKCIKIVLIYSRQFLKLKKVVAIL